MAIMHAYILTLFVQALKKRLQNRKLNRRRKTVVASSKL